MGEKVEIRPSGLTARSVILGIILCIFTTVVSHFTSLRDPFFFLWDVNFALGVTVILVPINALLPARTRLRPQEWAVALAMLWVSVFSTFFGWDIWPNFAYFPLNVPLEEKILYSPLWWPWDETAANQAMTGGFPVPWNILTVPTILWELLFGALTFAVLFWCIIWRKQVIEVEKINFCWADPVADLIKWGQSEESRPVIFKQKLFWASTLISFLMWLPLLINEVRPGLLTVAPELPGSAAWVGYPYGGSVNLIPYTSAYLPDAYLFLNWNPQAVSLWYFFPLDVLQTIWGGMFLLYVIAPPIMVSMGIIPDVSKLGENPVYRAAGCDYGPRWMLTFTWGGFLGLGFIYILYHWRQLLGFLRQIMKPIKSEPGDISVRSAWIGLGICGIIIIALLASYGAPAWLIIPGLVFAGFYFWSYILMRGYSGSWALAWSGLQGASWFTIPYWENYNNRDAATAYSFGFVMTDDAPCITASTSASVMYSFKLGLNLNTRPKDIAIACGIGLAVSMALTGPLWLWESWAVGVKGWYGSGIHDFYATGPAAAGAFNIPHMSELMTRMIAGAIIQGIIYVLYMRFPWFWINPFALAQGLMYDIGGGFMWFSFFLAWIIKYTVLKIGGTKLYQRTLPLFSGLATGYCLLSIVTGVYVTAFWIGQGLR